MTLFVSLERGGSIGALWHATGTNGDAAGSRSSKSMINGTTGDTERWREDSSEVSSALARPYLFSTLAVAPFSSARKAPSNGINLVIFWEHGFFDNFTSKTRAFEAAAEGR
ncbi:unnamed protein product [Heligmosomoides polygyrus]|uniref:Uncharacterized protein n=1 Tax=Heligmosomoides polygyrus TaxID=6339 RepID=A0A183GPS4_HELPZ|nr:unnamed protein product [Heligmosomoides polygyrus]